MLDQRSQAVERAGQARRRIEEASRVVEVASGRGRKLRVRQERIDRPAQLEQNRVLIRIGLQQQRREIVEGMRAHYAAPSTPCSAVTSAVIFSLNTSGVNGF